MDDPFRLGRRVVYTSFVGYVKEATTQDISQFSVVDVSPKPMDVCTNIDLRTTPAPSPP